MGYKVKVKRKKGSIHKIEIQNFITFDNNLNIKYSICSLTYNSDSQEITQVKYYLMFNQGGESYSDKVVDGLKATGIDMEHDSFNDVGIIHEYYEGNKNGFKYTVYPSNIGFNLIYEKI